MKAIAPDIARKEFAKISEPNDFFGGRRAMVSGRGQPPSFLQVLSALGEIVNVTVKHSGTVQTYWVEL